MPSFATGTVTGIRSARRGLQRVDVDLGTGEPAPAYVLTDLVGPVELGEEVVLNTTAVDLGLGTGGWHVVHWNLSRRAWSAPGPGHVLKLRYTSLQTDVGAAEEVEGYAAPRDLGGRPVVVCALHSQLAGVAAGFRHGAPDRRLVYVMTDGGALPLALSDLVTDLVDHSLLAATVTAGHAFGGDLEAVNVASALDVAVAVAEADAVVVAPGPGVVGTGTASGFSGLEVATTLDAAALAGATPIVCVRWSDADARARHRGVSHHTRTALARAHHPALVPRPDDAPAETRDAFERHLVRDLPAARCAAALAESAVTATTMGRTQAQDPAFFSWAAAAGLLAAGHVC